MKTKLSITLLLLIWQCVSFMASAVTITPVDSMTKVIRGGWYETQYCSEFSGQCDSVYSMKQNFITKAIGSDSLCWKISENGTTISSSNYFLTKKTSILTHQEEWMLCSPYGYNTIIHCDGNKLDTYVDGITDGDYIGYSRVMNEKVPTQSRIDSLASCMSGKWYDVILCSGMTGKCDSVYSTTTLTITTMLGTDTIKLNDEKFKIIETANNIIGEMRWMLEETVDEYYTTNPITGTPMIPAPHLREFVSCSNGGLGLSMDGYDAGGIGYARTPREKKPEQLRVDSIASCMSGEWYDVYGCNGFTGKCDSVYSGMKYTITPIANTDSITITGVTLNPNQVGLFYVKYKIIETVNNTRNVRSWMLETEESLPPVDGHDLETEFLARYFINCSNGQFSMQLDGFDTPFNSYARTPRLETIKQLRIDTIADCLSGDWYLVYKCNNSGLNQCDSITGSYKTIFVHTQGSDSIEWRIYTNLTNFTSTKYRISDSYVILTGQNKFMLGTTIQPECYTTPCYPIELTSSIDCQDSILNISGNLLGAPSGTYLRISRGIPQGILETKNNNLGFAITPNPVKTNMFIKGEKEIDKITIYNLQGAPILAISGNERVVNLSTLKKGMYILQITSANKTQSIPILKE